MLNPERFPGSLFRSWRFPSWRSSSWRAAGRAVGASAGILALVLAVSISVHHAPYAAASDSGPLAANIVRSATDLSWRQSPASALGSPGKNSVTLDPCPPGVFAAEPWYYVYIAGAGTPEAVRVTGGTCKGDGRPGTLEFTTANAHPSGYVVSSASLPFLFEPSARRLISQVPSSIATRPTTPASSLATAPPSAWPSTSP
jgi:hypothetical protein